MRDLDDLRRKVGAIDRRIEQLRAGRRQRRHQMVQLLDAVEQSYRRQREELAGARRQIKVLEEVVGDLSGKLQTVLAEVAEDVQESEAMVGRLAHLGRRGEAPAKPSAPVRAAPPQTGAKPMKPTAPVQTPATRSESSPAPDLETTRGLLDAQEKRRKRASPEQVGSYDRELERLVREAKFFYEDL